jgi:hypothetical protein
MALDEHTPLPAELWGEIFKNIDDPFDLWVNCRRVSSTLRTEAEHVFRTRFLPQLSIHWRYLPYNGRDGAWFYVDAQLNPKWCCSNSSLARFELSIYGPFGVHSRKKRFSSDQERDARIVSILEYKDINFFRQADPVYGDLFVLEHSMDMSLNDDSYYCNDANQLDFEMQFNPAKGGAYDDDEYVHNHPGNITTDWKVLITAFFNEEAFVRHRTPNLKLFDEVKSDFQAILADSTKAFVKNDSSLAEKLETGKSVMLGADDFTVYSEMQRHFNSQCGKAREKYIEDVTHIHMLAYASRLERTFSKAYLQLQRQKRWKANNESDMKSDPISAHVYNIVGRRDTLLRIYADRIWVEKFGKVKCNKE